MKYLVEKSFIKVLGIIWLPSVKATYQYDLRDYDIRNMTNLEGEITRQGIKSWLSTNAGDFQEVIDFSASIELNRETLDFDWEKEENEVEYMGITHPVRGGE